METNDVISISQFKATCLTVLDKVNRTGRSVLVTRHGKPIAMIDPAPLPVRKESWLGSYWSNGKIIGDIISPASAENDWGVLNE